MFCVALEFNCARGTASPKIRLNLMTPSHRGTASPQHKGQSGENRPIQAGPAQSPRGLRTFRAKLLAWYDANKRDLPWRVTKDAYCIWLSEIMLQQTRVAVVKEYYPRFLKRFPTLAALAAARVSSVLAAWSGLGYYRRARALHAASRVVARKLEGRFPRTAEELRALPGVGAYTAAAVASIAFDQPVAVVDGNVERVLTRLFGGTFETATVWKRARELLDAARPGDFNQAMMELGATLCLPRQPLCESCPVYRWCVTRGEFGEKAVQSRKKSFVRYCLARSNGSVFLVRRPGDASLMAGMWELPELTGQAEETANGFKVRHSITVTDYAVEVVSGEPPLSASGRWVPVTRVTRLPLTGLTRKIFRHAGII